MATTVCFCGVESTAANDDALVEEMRRHLAEAHGLAVSAVMTRNAIERQRQLGPVPDPLPEIDPPALQRLGVDDAADYTRFFDEDAFTDNVGWASCYCMFHHLDPSTFDERIWQQNRDDAIARIQAGEMSGVLARVDGAVAGWVNAAVRTAYPAHCTGEADDATTGAIVCFVVAPRYRGHGLARLLLDAAVEMLTDAGLTAVEAYPAAEARSAAAAYHGTVGMYRDAGFEPVTAGVMRRRW